MVVGKRGSRRKGRKKKVGEVKRGISDLEERVDEGEENK